SCDLCQMTFTRTSLVMDHKFRIHGNRKLFSCPECVYRADLYRHLMKHIKRKHPSIKKFNLDVNTSPLREDETPNPGLKCPECKKTAKSRSGLFNHKRMLHGAKDVKCTDCEAAFSNEPQRKFHSERTHRGKFNCSFTGCSKTFRDRWNLETHMKSHIGKKDCICSLCDYSCVQLSSLKAH
ncbi:hypothetical protein CAPTEDRAFT_75946, partial [Capitella teleta]